MTHIIIPGQPPGCPLCSKSMVEAFLPNGSLVYRCYQDSISIDTRDPMIGRWNTEKPECVHCKSLMNMFLRSDGYIKCHCPNCHAEVESIPSEEETEQ